MYINFNFRQKTFRKSPNFYSERAVKELAAGLEKAMFTLADLNGLLTTQLLLCFKEISSTPDHISILKMHLNYAKNFVTQINVLQDSNPFFIRCFIIQKTTVQPALYETEGNFSANANTNYATIDLNSSAEDKNK